jgi:hypothetical protein
MTDHDKTREALRLLAVQGCEELTDLQLRLRAEQGDAFSCAILNARAALAASAPSRAVDLAARLRAMAELTDKEFDALHDGRELLPIEQAIYEAEGAERFARAHGHGRSFPKQAWPAEPDAHQKAQA